MVEITRLLQLRAIANKKRPRFIRLESWRYVRLKTPWRRQRGLDNKVRKKKKGALKSPNVGYRNPRKTRYLHSSGFQEVLIHNLKEIEKINPKKQVAKIAHAVGRRKRVLLQDRADELNILILNRIRVLLPGEEMLLEKGRGFERETETKEVQKATEKAQLPEKLESSEEDESDESELMDKE
jgi:large subunit ribosomal protein L32e